MASVFFSPDRPRVLAHRGLTTGGVPENTLLAFARALATGAGYIETDVHLSLDGIAVVSHDPGLDRLLGRDLRVDQLTMAELRKLELGSGQGFASLEEALDALPDARFNIDVKTDAAVEAAALAIESVRARERVLVTSFSDARRRRLSALLPGVAASAGSRAVVRARAAVTLPGLRRALTGVDALQAPERAYGAPIVTRRFVERVHAAGTEVHVWTVNDPADMERLLDLGVDGLVTDRADLAMDVVRRRA